MSDQNWYAERERRAIDDEGLRLLADALAATDEFGDAFVIEQTGGFVMVGFVYGPDGRDAVHASVTGAVWDAANDAYDVQVYADADEQVVTESQTIVGVPALFDWARAFLATLGSTDEPDAGPAQYHYVVRGELRADGTAIWAIDSEVVLSHGWVWDPTLGEWRNVNPANPADRDADLALIADLGRRLHS